MTDLAEIQIVSTVENALRKVKKAEIAVYDLKKEGARLIFFVKHKDVKKIFAIFDKPCYNIKVIKKSRISRLLSFAAVRAGLIAGAAIFVAAAVIANTFVLKIKVSGNGSYLEAEVRKIIYEEGAGEFKRFSALNASTATGRILALPQVTFCNIEKRGSVLVVDVQTDAEHYGSADKQPLLSDCDGVVKNVVAVCGTAAVKTGDTVKRGDVLIYAHTLAGEQTVSCLAAGYAEIECARTAEFFAETDDEENLKRAYSSLLLEGEEIISKSHTVKPTEGGVVFVINFSYLHRISINLT
ncbi:MAG: hypothetical protein HFE41_04965 [Clostridia bacterium]|nr:hypothetical protein [Clostridia bacterium]